MHTPASSVALDRAISGEIQHGLTFAIRETMQMSAFESFGTLNDSPTVIGPDARWMITAYGERRDLARYGPARRLLLRLVEHRFLHPGETLSAGALIDAGWPGEQMRYTAGLLRVYSAIRRLRRLGLASVLVTRDDGYLLDPDADVRRMDRAA